MSQELIDGLLSLRKKVSEMEKDLKMPKNTLASILKGTKPFPPKWATKAKEYIAINQATKEEKFTLEEIEKKMHDPAYLSTFLLKHPNPESVRIACLHYLGDDYQKLAHFVKISGAKIPDIISNHCTWHTRMQQTAEAIENQPAAVLTTSSTNNISVPKIDVEEAFIVEIKATTYSGDLQKVMKEIEANTELGAIKKAELRIIANDHRTNFTN